MLGKAHVKSWADEQGFAHESIEAEPVSSETAAAAIRFLALMPPHPISCI
jgi:hypothetical protein